jgi:hypothetical protein
MTAVRRLASGLLRGVQRHAPAACQEWASAMLRELDFIESDWAALFWALGSTTAIFRHSGGGLKLWFAKESGNGEESMNTLGKRVVGVVSGALLAALLVVCAFGLLALSFYAFPGLGLEHVEWTHWLTVIVIPEAIFAVAAVMLWRKRGSVAAGILVTAAVLGLHVVIHLATHGKS